MSDTPSVPHPRGSVPWEGAVNARDLGGIAGMVAHGRVYRMGRREWLTDRGWQQAWDDGVRTVIDLRSPGEVGRRGTDPAVKRAPEQFLLLNLPTEDQSDPEFTAVCGPYLNSPRYYRYNLERWPEKFAAVARAVASSPPGGVIVHCAAGRDRTGMVSALLLSACGVPAEAILEDYAVAVRSMNDYYRGQDAPREKPRAEPELDGWLSETRAHLHELLDTLDAEAYLLGAGVTPAEVAALRHRILA